MMNWKNHNGKGPSEKEFHRSSFSRYGIWDEPLIYISKGSLALDIADLSTYLRGKMVS
jgi:hypothetical protein